MVALLSTTSLPLRLKIDMDDTALVKIDDVRRLMNSPEVLDCCDDEDGRSGSAELFSGCALGDCSLVEELRGFTAAVVTGGGSGGAYDGAEGREPREDGNKTEGSELSLLMQ